MRMRYRLQRNPVLTALVVCWLVFALTALAASVAVWRGSSSCSIPRRSTSPYVVHVVEDAAGLGGAPVGIRLLHAV
jgi:hypothetical protein